MAGLAAMVSRSKADILVPPENFALVERGLYRGAFPKPKNFAFLRTLGLRTILSLKLEKTNEYPAANTAFNLARLDVSTGIAACIGQDLFGTFIRQTLEATGVDTAGLVHAPDTSSAKLTRTLACSRKRFHASELT